MLDLFISNVKGFFIVLFIMVPFFAFCTIPIFSVRLYNYIVKKYVTSEDLGIILSSEYVEFAVGFAVLFLSFVAAFTVLGIRIHL